jgi:hypothetical protein
MIGDILRLDPTLEKYGFRQSFNRIPDGYYLFRISLWKIKLGIRIKPPANANDEEAHPILRHAKGTCI